MTLNLTCFAVATGLVDTHAHPLWGICSVSCTLWICSNTRSPALLHKRKPSVQLNRATWSPAEPMRPFMPLLTATALGPLRRLMHRSKLYCSPSGSPAKEWSVRLARKIKIKWCLQLLTMWQTRYQIKSYQVDDWGAGGRRKRGSS